MARGETFAIELDGMRPEWQNLHVSAVVHNREAAEHGITAVKEMRQRVLVREVEGGPWVDISAPKQLVDWRLHCPQGSPTCDRAFVLLRSGLPYRAMRLELSLPPERGDAGVERFMGEVTFTTRHETVGDDTATRSV